MARIDYFNDPAAPTANSVFPSVTVGVRDGADSLLLIHKIDNDRWALPGGGHEAGERIADTVMGATARTSAIRSRYRIFGLPWTVL